MLFLPTFAQADAFSLDTEKAGQAVIRWEQGEVMKLVSPGGYTVKQFGEPVVPLFLGYPHGPKDAQFAPEGRIRHTFRISVNSFSATIGATDQTFACTASRSAPVGSTFGRPQSELFDSIYDRSRDWLITFESPALHIKTPGQTGYGVRSDKPCTIVFRPNYYRDHLGYFLWDKSKPLWKRPVAGWCSWMAHLQDVKESDVVNVAKFFSKNLKDYGYNVIQIDDGYQRVKQFGQDQVSGEAFSTYWTKPNEQFPSGMDGLAAAIKSAGMIPGVWIGYYLPLGLKNAKG